MQHTIRRRVCAMLLLAFLHPAFGDETVKEQRAPDPGDISDTRTWGAADNVVGVDGLYFSKQPDEATFAEAKKHDVRVVIDLREPAETDWDEAGAAKEAGLTYYNVAVAGSGSSFDAAAMQKISALVREHQDHGILLHCSSGNRASAWFAIHLVEDLGMEIEPALALAHKTGLDKPPVEARVREYLGAETH